jgi:hypothetical protein
MDPHNPYGSHSGGGSSKGSTPDVKGKGTEILDGLHPRIETRGQSRRHEKKPDKKKGHKSSRKSVVTKDAEGTPSERAQADSVAVEDVAASPHSPHPRTSPLRDEDDCEGTELPRVAEDTEATGDRQLGVQQPRGGRVGP